jgi:hypothetical protein
VRLAATVFCTSQLAILQLERYDVLSLGAFGAFGDCELNFLAFSQGFETLSLDGTEVSKHVRSGFLLDKTKAFSFVKPFNGSSSSRHNINPINLSVCLALQEGRLAESDAITYEKQDEELLRVLRNGEHKYKTYVQAGASITRIGPTSTKEFA